MEENGHGQRPEGARGGSAWTGRVFRADIVCFSLLNRFMVDFYFVLSYLSPNFYSPIRWFTIFLKLSSPLRSLIFFNVFFKKKKKNDTFEKCVVVNRMGNINV